MRITQTIDVEHLISWALDCTGRLPWLRDNPRELSLDRGYTARPRRKQHVSWAQVEAYAGRSGPEIRAPLGEIWEGLTLHGHTLSAMRVPGDDAQAVLGAIQRLDPASAALVLLYGRKRCRPDWMPGVEPERVSRTIRRGSRKSVSVRRWEPCSPQELVAAREDYTRWQAALVSLADALSGRLTKWEIVGPRTRAAPWLVAAPSATVSAAL